MKQTPELDRVQAEMQPGVIVQYGFLGPDRRRLADILEADDASVKQLGLTHRQIALRLTDLRTAAVKGLGLTVGVPPHFEARVDGVRGRLPCPFGHAGLFDKTFCEVRNLRLDESILFTDLQIHLIGEHGFYEGEGSPFRLVPYRLIQVLEIEKGLG